MNIYLVGGYIRDKLLGIKSNDKDYLVVNSTVNEMLDLGFIPIGKDFPVFIHPYTKEEYALARTEKKNGLGHKDFLFYASKDVSLEEDLRRRDLTINALAEDKNGKIYDFFNGIQDIENRILRHISESFLEDPLRVLRLARFKSTLSKFNFIIDKSTISLISQISSEEFRSLSSDRVVAEMKKAFTSENFMIFFEVLSFTEAFNVLFPELSNNFIFYKQNILLSLKDNKYQLNFYQKIILIFLISKVESVNFSNFVKRYNLGRDLVKQYQKIQENIEFLLNLHFLNTEEFLYILKQFDFFRRPNILIESLKILNYQNVLFLYDLKFLYNKDKFSGLSKEEILKEIDLYRKDIIQDFFKKYF